MMVKNMSFKTEDDNAYLPYIEIRNKIKRESDIRFDISLFMIVNT